MNKTVVNLKIRRMTDIATREALAKKKGEHDWVKSLIMVLTIIIIGVLAFTIITQFMNYTEVSSKFVELNTQLGVCRGELAVAQTIAPAATGVINA